MSKWQTSPLASVCTVFGDGDWIESKDQSPEGVRLIQTGNVGEGEFKDRVEKARFVSHETFTRLRCSEIFPGDCLISRLPDPVGRACLVPETGERMITAVDCTIVRFDQTKVLPEYFAYYSQSGDYLSAVEREATGTTRRRISRARLGLVPIPLATLREQRRIVAILDEAFEAIAVAKANSEKNLQNARELFENVLQDTFDTDVAAWPVQRLGALCTHVTDGTHNSPPYVETGVAMLDSKHIGDAFDIDDSRAEKFISPEVDAQLAQRCKPGSGDILISSRGTIGKIAIVQAGQDFNIMGNMILLRLPQDVDRHFIAFYMLSRVAHIESIARGVAQKGLYLGQVRDYDVPVPPHDQQRLIAQRLRCLQLESARLSEVISRKLRALDDLKKSLLNQAFTGALTAKASEAPDVETS